MENNKLPNQFESALRDFNDFIKESEETKKSYKEILELNVLLQEELKVALEAEKNAQSKKNRCQAFVNQQQEFIQRLLTVKEENENLKSTISQTEQTLALVQNNSIAELVKKDAKIQEIEQEYLKKLINVQEDANAQAEKIKTEYSGTIEELKTSISKLEEKLEEKDSMIISLQEEVQNVKDWSYANTDTFHKRLAEQERRYQAELETWKMAELNRTAYEQAQMNSSVSLYGTHHNYLRQYQSPQLLRPVQERQPNAFCEPTSSYQKTPLVTHLKSNLPRPNTNLVRPLTSGGSYQSKTGFLSANDIYLQNNTFPSSNNEKSKDEDFTEGLNENNQPSGAAPKPKIPVTYKKRKLFNSNQNLL